MKIDKLPESFTNPYFNTRDAIELISKKINEIIEIINQNTNRSEKSHTSLLKATEILETYVQEKRK